MRNALLALSLCILPSVITPALAQPRGRAVLFADVEFRGEQRMVDREVRDFRDIGFNDLVSSIRVEAGTWQFCEDADFRGRCITLSRDDRNLVPEGFNDRISSARMVSDRDARGDGRDNGRGNGPGPGPGAGRGDDVTLFADIGFSGDRRQSGENRDFRSLNFNDTVSSIRIRSGTWEFCQDADFRGRCMTF